MKAKALHTTVILLSLGFAAYAQPQDSTAGGLQITAEPGITQMQQKYIEENKRKQELDGYRVQIYNGTKRETLNKRSKFLNVFPSVNVYTIYEAPEYKVQAGDFRTRLEAEKFLTEVTARFGSGFVVKTKIKFPELNPRTEEE